MKRIGFIVLLLFSLNPTSPGSSVCSDKEKREKIVGIVVAQASLPLCVYHPCAAWLIVRLSDSGHGQTRYAQLAVEYFPDAHLPDGGFPTELVATSKEWKFEAVRKQDQQFEEFMKVVDLETKQDLSEKWAARAWRLLPGAEGEHLPFGQVLPYYEVSTHRYRPHGKSR